LTEATLSNLKEKDYGTTADEEDAISRITTRDRSANRYIKDDKSKQAEKVDLTKKATPAPQPKVPATNLFGDPNPKK
jgi:hypothetical protein